MKGLILMALMVTAFVVRELWTLVRHRREIIYPFPYATDQGIAFQTYWFMFGTSLFLAIVAIILWRGMPSQEVFWYCVMVLQVAELIEYCLNYNRVWGSFKGININITNFRYLVLSIAAIYELIVFRWKE